jgi:hypothetical protein
MAIGLLLFTNIDPFYGGLFIVGAITFILVYMLILIHHIAVPFHDMGASRDDVSLFLLREARLYLESQQQEVKK